DILVNSRCGETLTPLPTFAGRAPQLPDPQVQHDKTRHLLHGIADDVPKNLVQLSGMLAYIWHIFNLG
ncbi:MAG TPA: hypothetical protein VKE72_10275, partial [Methylocella sp.]|nr:hypothetical protein [Methylocella sp.]